MIVIVNGNNKECSEKTTLLALIESLGIKVEVMAAAVNMEIVKKDAWESHLLKENDRVELLHFVGGG